MQTPLQTNLTFITSHHNVKAKECKIYIYLDTIFLWKCLYQKDHNPTSEFRNSPQEPKIRPNPREGVWREEHLHPVWGDLWPPSTMQVCSKCLSFRLTCKGLARPERLDCPASRGASRGRQNGQLNQFIRSRGKCNHHSNHAWCFCTVCASFAEEFTLQFVARDARRYSPRVLIG